MLKYQIKLNPSGGSQAVSCGQTDGQNRHDEANSRFSQFCESTYKCVPVFHLIGNWIYVIWRRILLNTETNLPSYIY
jgi:hypothetical protein